MTLGSSRAFILAMMCAGRPACGVFLLAADEAQKALGHGERGDEQRAVVVDLGVRGEVVEDDVRALGDLRVGGEQAEVGVEAGGDGVVVAGAEVAVAAGDAVFVVADEQGELAVGLEAEDAVEDLDAGVFEVARPADVGGFVEAGHEFNDDSHVLVLRGIDERLEDGRVVAGAIQSLLDGEDARIGGARLDKSDDAVVGVEGVVEHDVAVAQIVEEIGGAAAEAQLARHEGLELEIGTVGVAVEVHQAREVDGAVSAEDLAIVELKVDAQPVDDLGIGADSSISRRTASPLRRLCSSSGRSRAGRGLLPPRSRDCCCG